jgi:signal transduction histidine kinase
VLGSILFAGDKPRHFGRHDEQLAATIACHVAQAVARARLFDAERTAHAAAEMAVRAREDILAVVSHDLRNPLGAVLMTAEGVLSFDEVSDQVRPKLERIKRVAERMARLIDDLVDFGSIQAGRLTIDARAWDPAELIGGAIEMLAAAAEERGVILVAEVPGGTPAARCDRERTVQVLSNLMANAVKVTPRGGQVTVTAAVRGAEVELAVTDTGPGIDPGELPHVFERYWRSRNASYRGSGLGLTIASALVRAQGGRIGADSQVGAGSRFYFTLPVASR